MQLTAKSSIWSKSIYKEIDGINSSIICAVKCLMDDFPCHFYLILYKNCFLGNIGIENGTLLNSTTINGQLNFLNSKSISQSKADFLHTFS